MKLNRAFVKKAAKRKISERGIKVIYASAIYFGLTMFISVLISQLSGYSKYADELYAAYENYLKGADLVINILWPEVSAVALVLAAAIFLLSLVLGGGFLNYCLLVSRDMAATYKTLFDGFYYFSKIILISFFRTVLIFAGCLLFIAPGIILMYSYRLSIYILFDNPEMSAAQCMKQSRKLMKGYKAQLFWLDISFLGWQFVSSVLSLFALPILDVWINPYIGITRAKFYNSIINYEKIPDLAEPAV